MLLFPFKLQTQQHISSVLWIMTFPALEEERISYSLIEKHPSPCSVFLSSCPAFSHSVITLPRVHQKNAKDLSGQELSSLGLPRVWHIWI